MIQPSVLFFDTETTGVPRDYKAPTSDFNNWPRMVQLAWLITDEEGGELDSFEAIIRPNGFVIPADAARVHGITTQHALEVGHAAHDVLQRFVAALASTSLLIAHNMAFDEKIVGAELLRHGMHDALLDKPRACTMLRATDFCKLPGRYGYKWPTLQQLHARLFQEEFRDAHQAIADVRACARCYFELKRRNVM